MISEDRKTDTADCPPRNDMVLTCLSLAGDDFPSSKTLYDSVESGEPLAQHYDKVSLSWERRLWLVFHQMSQACHVQ